MNSKLYGAGAGALIVSLALTAGNQYAAAQSANKYWSECTQQSIASAELLTSAQTTTTQMITLVEKQNKRIAELELALEQSRGPSSKL